MWRTRFALLIAVILAVNIVAPIHQAAAYPPCGDLQPPNQPSNFCRPKFGNNQLVNLRDHVPFGWLHTEPASDAPIVATIMPTPYASLRIAESCSYWDGYQWWWHVARYPENISVGGWIEQAALQYAAHPPDRSGPYIVQEWQTPVAGQVEPGIPFVWVRTRPASDALVITVLPANGTFTIIGPQEYDGNQIWWRIQVGDQIGYVEQSLIIAVP